MSGSLKLSYDMMEVSLTSLPINNMGAEHLHYRHSIASYSSETKSDKA